MAKILKAVKLCDGPPSSTKSFISWERLSFHLKISNEIKPNETATHFEILEDGILYGVKKVDKP